jgi:hypothetical protein
VVLDNAGSRFGQGARSKVLLELSDMLKAIGDEAEEVYGDSAVSIAVLKAILERSFPAA